MTYKVIKSYQGIKVGDESTKKDGLYTFKSHGNGFDYISLSDKSIEGLKDHFKKVRKKKVDTE